MPPDRPARRTALLLALLVAGTPLAGCFGSDPTPPPAGGATATPTPAPTPTSSPPPAEPTEWEDPWSGTGPRYPPIPEPTPTPDPMPPTPPTPKPLPKPSAGKCSDVGSLPKRKLPAEGAALKDVAWGDRTIPRPGARIGIETEVLDGARLSLGGNVTLERAGGVHLREGALRVNASPGGPVDPFRVRASANSTLQLLGVRVHLPEGFEGFRLSGDMHAVLTDSVRGDANGTRIPFTVAGAAFLAVQRSPVEARVSLAGAPVVRLRDVPDALLLVEARPGASDVLELRPGHVAEWRAPYPEGGPCLLLLNTTVAAWDFLVPPGASPVLANGSARLTWLLRDGRHDLRGAPSPGEDGAMRLGTASLTLSNATLAGWRVRVEGSGVVTVRDADLSGEIVATGSPTLHLENVALDALRAEGSAIVTCERCTIRGDVVAAGAARVFLTRSTVDGELHRASGARILRDGAPA